MVQWGQAVDGVISGERGSRGGAEGRQRPAVVGDLLGLEIPAASGVEHHVGHVAGEAGVGPVPPGQFHRVGVDLLHVDHGAARRQIKIAGIAAAEYQRLHRQSARGGQIRRVGDQLGDTAESSGRGEVAVGGHQHGDAAQTRQRGDRHHRAGAGVHQHADASALSHAYRDQASHYVVDTPVDGVVGVHAAVEQEELALGHRLGLFGDDAPQRDSGVIVDLAQPHQARQRAHGLNGQRAQRLVDAGDGVGGSAGDRRGQLGGLGDTVHDARTHCHTGLAGTGGRVRHRRDVVRAFGAAGEPLHPRRDGGPGDGGRLRPDNQPEVAGPDHHFVRLRLGRGAFDAPHRGGLPDVVDLADERQHRTGDVGQRHQLALDGEPAGHHPVV